MTQNEGPGGLATTSAAEKETGEAAMLDMAFAAMTRELGLGDDAGFILSRSAVWWVGLHMTGAA